VEDDAGLQRDDDDVVRHPKNGFYHFRLPRFPFTLRCPRLTGFGRSGRV
jgi:hypothetical protein